MNWKKDEDGKLVVDEGGDPMALSESGEVIPLDKVVSLGKHARVESERDELKAQVDKLTGDIEALNASAGDAEKLKAEVERITAESESAKTEWEGKLASREKNHEPCLTQSHFPRDTSKSEDAERCGLITKGNAPVRGRLRC